MVKNISGKTGATGAIGTASGVGLAPLIVWALALFGIDMDAATAAVLGGLLGNIATFLVAWLMPAKSGTYVQTEEPVEEDMYDPAVEAGIEDDPEIPDPNEFDLAEVV
ncbi:hypothetical protein [Brevibacterium sp. CFH 10365]|uniref:hypothetical protein n=1 Tax=Brevibacterium sp. CFH 10365 TaxID=2585207 RepID=UPI0012668560|nr:hypothetical protein [Brevibacterium sp. CFH 10365]